MQRIFCPQCALSQPSSHLHCIRCGTSLPLHLMPDAPAKATRFFAGVRIDHEDPQAAFLRVSCYLKEQTFTSAEGSALIPGRHVLFSVWVDDTARCALSLTESEALELSHFIDEELRALSPAR